MLLIPALALWRLRGRLRADAFAVLGLATVVYLLAIGGPIGNARFRVPLVPYFAWFAVRAADERA